jgi:outer membrane receptor for ferrienterochelin and colicins
MILRSTIFLILFLFFSAESFCQKIIKGIVLSEGKPVQGAVVAAHKARVITKADGRFEFEKNTPIHIQITHINFETKDTLIAGDSVIIELDKRTNSLEDVVVTGSMRLVTKAESAVPVEVFSPKFFQKMAPPNVFEAVCMINGVKPQLNCNICNTGDIHINGMEGAYTQVLIDGMPIVSGLATVYGLMGIPLSMVERIEVIKGPAGSLYGSEAMAGTINIITKNPLKAPRFSADINLSSWGELNTDIGFRLKTKKLASITGINYYNYTNPLDKNKDGFTDVTIQNRISLFTNWGFTRKSAKQLTAGARLYYEDRWGGEMTYTKVFRGTDSIYGESIYTKRLELFGAYELPLKEKIMMNWSVNFHDQNSYYGTTPFNAQQHIGFTQFYWNKQLSSNHYFLTGVSSRFTYYDDNTTATKKAEKIFIPAIFLQDEWKFGKQSSLLGGIRFDHHPLHGIVTSPRIALKLQPFEKHTLRTSLGTGFRVVNIFTEDHAALTGAREVVINGTLKPERSVNGVINWQYNSSNILGSTIIEGGGFYTLFSNKILPDYDTDPNKIIYQNLQGNATSRGIFLNVELDRAYNYRLSSGITYMNVFQTEKGIKEQQLLAAEWSGNFSISKTLGSVHSPLTADITGNWYGPMRLPILPNDYRPEYSPFFSLINLQVSKKWKLAEIYGGMKNVFDFVPADPLMRPFDPFDKTANDLVSNPNGYTFDPSYNYAPLQGRRFYLGLRINVK